MKSVRIVLLSLSSALLPALAQAATVCPALTNASAAYYAAIPAAGTNCNTLLTINADGTVTITLPNMHPYDGNDDNYVGVVNNYGGAVAGITLTGNDLFGFDGDGIDAYGIAGNTIDTSKYGTSAYGGMDAYYNVTNANSGIVNFIGGIASGGTGYFSLEEAPSVGGITTGPVMTTTPEPSSLILLATGALGLAGAVRRRIKI